MREIFLKLNLVGLRNCEEVKKMEKIELYGKLERIALDLHPTRSDMFFFMGTLNKKHSPEEIMRCINQDTQWMSYDNEHIEQMLNYLTKRKPNTFFSPLKKKPKKEWHYNKGWNRTVAHNEVALDLDSSESFQRAVKLFDEYQLKGNCRTWDGANGGHVSLFFDKPVNRKFRETVREFFKGDPGQINISLEGKPHQKTGNVVRFVRKKEGLNTIINILKMIEHENEKS
jgi:hypothetical protein